MLDLLDSRDRGEVEFDCLLIECTGMADPGPILQAFFAHPIICQRYLLDGVIALVDAVHAKQQLDQFTLAQSQIGYADRILLSKTDIAGDHPQLTERLQCINARAPIYPVVNGVIDLTMLFDTRGFMLEEQIVAAPPLFHVMPKQQCEIASIVVQLDYPVALDSVSKVMEICSPVLPITCYATKACYGSTLSPAACCSRACSASIALTGIASGSPVKRPPAR